MKNEATSKLKAAVRAKAWASPVQPMRSLRCGQSVGTSRKLPFWPQTDVALELVEERVGALEVAAGGSCMSEWTTQPFTLSSVSSPG